MHPSCPHPGNLTSVPSILLFNLLKNKTVLLGREGGPPQRCTNTYHAIHATVMQLQKCLQCGASLKGHLFFRIHGIFRLLKQMSFFINQKKKQAKDEIYHPHTQINTVKLHLMKESRQRLLITDSTLYLKFLQFLPFKKKNKKHNKP